MCKLKRRNEMTLSSRLLPKGDPMALTLLMTIDQPVDAGYSIVLY